MVNDIKQEHVTSLNFSNFRHLRQQGKADIFSQDFL